MKRLGPWLTLAAVAVLGLVLLVVNMSKDTEPSTAQPNSGPATSSVTAAPTTTAPKATPFPAAADYVATIPLAAGGTMTLEITVEGEKAIAYACDGKTIESWLQGPATNGTLKLTGKNDATLTGNFDGKAVNGNLSIGGKQWEFSALPVTPPAGLYVYNEGGVRQSWIVDGTGAVTGVQRGADGATTPAAPLNSDATAVVNGKKITATKVSGGDSVG
ncbi:hypothetical protein AB0H76_28295 [Nocardia sp. NPDC050712]|uniref:hypothetical protein n=1 Tax=Nocardia sp. NPDC050712 TaxID=3155518 RepID=UPI0033D2C299